jgi:ribosomal protein S18 acetylase RimI-like enzyme
MQREVRPYQRRDRHALSQLLNEAADQGQWSARRLDEHLSGILARDGRIWTLFNGDLLLGYALIDPIPGLDTLYDLQGYIFAQARRQGHGTHLLSRILADLRGSAVEQISHPVKSLASEAALFLLSQDFFVEHQEMRMELFNLARPALPRLPAGYYLQIFPAPLAISRFRHLYDDSFGGRPWYQPYRSDNEVSVELADPADLLFLMHDGHPAGFAWLRWPESDEAQIEPIGLTTLYQGRGLGHPFLLAILDQAAQQGARRISLGVWLDNKPAIRLYQNSGFRPIFTTTYLAHNIGGETQMSQ